VRLDRRRPAPPSRIIEGMATTQGRGRARAGTYDRDDGRRTERVLAAERRIGAVAHVLDDLVTVPGTGRRIGLDPVLGLVPFVGDIASALVAAWIVLEAARFRLPAVVLGRMIVNAVVDLLIGLVPFLGDVVDFGFKGNARNLELFHRHATDPGASTASHSAFLAGLALAGIGIAWIAVVLLGRLLALEL
jgi:hypothetical protein